MTSVYKSTARRPDNSKSLFVQTSIVPHGLYLVLFVWKPTEKFRSAMVVTDSFRIPEKPEEWAGIREGLIDIIKSGKLIGVRFDGENYEYVACEKPSAKGWGYETQNYGTKLIYPLGSPTFTPADPVESELDSISGEDYGL